MAARVEVKSRAFVAFTVACFGLLGTGCKSSLQRSLQHKPESRPGYSSDGDVSARRVQAPASESYRNEPGTTYTVPFPAEENAVPQYPAGLLSSRLPPVEVTVRVVVDGTGAVTDATISDNSGVQPEFGDAVLSAVRGWRFAPLKRRMEGKVESLPFSQQYRFVFTQVNGRAVVQSSSAAAR